MFSYHLKIYCRCGEFAQGGFDPAAGCAYLCDGCWAAKFAEAELIQPDQNVAVQSNPVEHGQAQEHGPLTPVQAKPAFVDIWSKLKMTCPAEWSEEAVWHYVETEFSWVGAKVYRVHVHPAAATPAVADVYLDFSMGRAKLTEVVKAMLAAPPQVVEDFIGGSVLVQFSSDSARTQPVQKPTSAFAETHSPRAHDQQITSPLSGSTAAAAGFSAQRAAGPLLTNFRPVDVAAKASPQPAAAAEAGNKLRMTCPAGWREAAVRYYVETEFSSVNARVFRAYVHLPPPGAGPNAAAVADVFLDFSMGRAKLGEAVRAMLAAPPKAVEDGVVVRFCTDAVADTIPQLAQVPATSSPDSSMSRQPDIPKMQSHESTATMYTSDGSAAQSEQNNQNAGVSPWVGKDSLDAAKASHAPAVVDSGNKLRMTCPARWREAAVRHYVEDEFSCVGARVYRAFVRPPPPGSSSAAVADVYLDFGMGRAKMALVVKAMLSAAPRAVDDGSANGRAIICFSPLVCLQTMP